MRLIILWLYSGLMLRRFVRSFPSKAFFRGHERSHAKNLKRLLVEGQNRLCRNWIQRRTISTRRLFSTETLSTETVYHELQKLSRELRRHDELYYSEQPELSDDEYDALARREAEICQDYPDLLERWQTESGLGRSATRFQGRVGSKTASGRTRRTHSQPMLSLDNVHDTQQLLAWLERVHKRLDPGTKLTILTEPKLDGLSLNLHYKRRDETWELEWASTRGDGKQGQDVTAAVRSCPSVPKTISWDGEEEIVEIRGEIVMPKTVFQEHNVSPQNENRTFSNARNAASGILLRKEDTVKEDEKDWCSKLRFYAYGLFCSESVYDGSEAIDKLSSLGMLTPLPTITTELLVAKELPWNETDISELLEYHGQLRKYKENPAMKSGTLSWEDYDMDGCVHKVSEDSIRQLLGNSNRAPRWAVAHKFPPTTAVTSLLDVFVQVGRTGALTPVALLDPVDLSGVTIQRATLHNFGHMQHILCSNQSIAKGTGVLVRRAGEVIPQVVSIVGQNDCDQQVNDIADGNISLVAPSKCPSCGSDVVVEESTNRSSSTETIGKVLRCSGPPLLCAPRAVSALQHAFSRDALDVAGLSESRIQDLMELGLLRLPSDLFLAAREPDEFVGKLSNDVEGWGEKSARNLASAANNVATDGVSLSRYIYSLGIRFVGVHSSALLARIYVSAEAFLEDIEAAGKSFQDGSEGEEESFIALREECEATKGIGPALISSLVAFSNSTELVEAAKTLASCIVIHNDDSLSSDAAQPSGSDSTSAKPLNGLSVVFTGSLQGLSRAKAKEMAKQMGAKSTPGSVSKSTGLVIYGEKGGKKLEQATALGVKVMPAEEFLKLANAFLSE